MELGYKIKKIRESKKISQQEVADLLFVSQKTYSNFESCKSSPSLMQICKLSNILEFDFLKFLNDIGISYNSNSNASSQYLEAINTRNLKEIILKKNAAQLKDKDEIIYLLKEKIKVLKKKLKASS